MRAFLLQDGSDGRGRRAWAPSHRPAAFFSQIGTNRRPRHGARSHRDGPRHGTGRRHRSRGRKLESFVSGCDTGRPRRNRRRAVDGARGTRPFVGRAGHACRRVAHKDYDLAINFEPDIRSNLLLALSGARRRAGFISGGGGAVLTDAVAPDPRAHIAENARALVMRAFETTGLKPRATSAESAGATSSESAVAQGFSPVTSTAKLSIPDEARRHAADLIGRLSPGGVAIGIQPAAGRRIKEWDPTRFAEVGSELARARGAKIVLIGSTSDREPLERFRASWPPDVPLVQLPVETDLVVLAAVLERLTLFITGDTGPMHLAAAVDTPVLAIFGPSLPDEVRAALSPIENRANRHPLQPVQSDAAAAVALPRTTFPIASRESVCRRASSGERDAGRVMTSRPAQDRLAIR